MTEPWFWRGESVAARAMRMALYPAASLYDAGQRLRWRLTRPFDSGVPVICVGNATTGGSGKTPFCLMLHKLLADHGIEAVFLSRGYGGALRGPTRVLSSHTAHDVGDEPLLLAAAAPTWIARDRASGAAAAAKAGARLIIMDDGFQNPSIKKSVGLLMVSGDEAGRAQFPAGPMREPLHRAVLRTDAIISVGADSKSEAVTANARLFHARTDIQPSVVSQPVVAFCGIARPERFFESLERKGFTLKAKVSFADHHVFSPSEMAALRAQADDHKAALITTEKDFVRMEPRDREGCAVARLTMTVDDPHGLVRVVRERIGR